MTEIIKKGKVPSRIKFMLQMSECGLGIRGGWGGGGGGGGGVLFHEEQLLTKQKCIAG